MCFAMTHWIVRWFRGSVIAAWSLQAERKKKRITLTRIESRSRRRTPDRDPTADREAANATPRGSTPDTARPKHQLAPAGPAAGPQPGPELRRHERRSPRLPHPMSCCAVVRPSPGAHALAAHSTLTRRGGTPRPTRRGPRDAGVSTCPNPGHRTRSMDSSSSALSRCRVSEAILRARPSWATAVRTTS